MLREHRIEFVDLKETYIHVANGRVGCQLVHNKNFLTRMAEKWTTASKFYGPSSTEVVNWLRHGYIQPGLTLDPPIEPIRKRRRLQFGEEGELQIDLALSGHDYPFLNWGSRDVLPGMKVLIYNNFVATTDVDIINASNRWVLRAIVALEAAGIDVELAMVFETTNLFYGSSDDLHQEVILKREGIQSDLLSWSAMLSPGGFRHLGFLASIIASDNYGYNVKEGLGYGMNQPSRFEVRWDGEKRTLEFKCPWSPRAFPEAEMDMQLRDVLAQSRRAA